MGKPQKENNNEKEPQTKEFLKTFLCSIQVIYGNAMQIMLAFLNPFMVCIKGDFYEDNEKCINTFNVREANQSHNVAGNYEINLLNES